MNATNLILFGDHTKLKSHFKNILSKSRDKTNSAKKRAEAASRDILPKLGVDHVDFLVKSNLNGGLTYLDQECKKDPHLMMPRDRADLLCWTSASSLVLIRTMRLGSEYVRKKKERVLVLVDTPCIVC